MPQAGRCDERAARLPIDTGRIDDVAALVQPGAQQRVAARLGVENQVERDRLVAVWTLLLIRRQQTDIAHNTWVIVSVRSCSARDRQMRMIGESAARDPGRLETILAEHTLIAEAVRDGDSNRTLDAIKVHLAGTERALGFTAD